MINAGLVLNYFQNPIEVIESVELRDGPVVSRQHFENQTLLKNSFQNIHKRMYDKFSAPSQSGFLPKSEMADGRANHLLERQNPIGKSKPSKTCTKEHLLPKRADC